MNYISKIQSHKALTPGYQPLTDTKDHYLALIGFDSQPVKSCFIIVRLDEDTHQGEKFEATIKAATSVFADVKVILADDLYAHSCGDLKTARAAGQKWLRQHEEMLQDCGIQKVIRWAELRNNPAYKEKKKQFYTLIKSNPNAARMIQVFCANRARHLGSYTDRNNFKAIMNSRLDELAGLSLLRDQGQQAELAVETETMNEERYYDNLSSASLMLPRSYPVSYVQIGGGDIAPLEFED